jgi:hypothetical protein
MGHGHPAVVCEIFRGMACAALRRGPGGRSPVQGFCSRPPPPPYLIGTGQAKKHAYPPVGCQPGHRRVSLRQRAAMDDPSPRLWPADRLTRQHWRDPQRTVDDQSYSYAKGQKRSSRVVPGAGCGAQSRRGLPGRAIWTPRALCRQADMFASTYGNFCYQVLTALDILAIIYSS